MLFINYYLKWIIYFNSFVVEHILKEIKKIVERSLVNKSVVTINTYRIQAYDSVMCGYFFIGFIDFAVKGKSLKDFTNLFSPSNITRNDNMILNYYKNRWST